MDWPIQLFEGEIFMNHCQEHFLINVLVNISRIKFSQIANDTQIHENFFPKKAQ